MTIQPEGLILLGALLATTLFLFVLVGVGAYAFRWVLRWARTFHEAQVKASGGTVEFSGRVGDLIGDAERKRPGHERRKANGAQVEERAS